MDKEKARAFGLDAFGAIGTIVTLIMIFTPNIQELSSQITQDLDLAYHDCNNLNDEKKLHLQQTLQSAEKALSVEKNYSKSASLVQSVSNDLLICRPLMELPPAGAELALLTIFILALAVGIRLTLKSYGIG